MVVDNLFVILLILSLFVVTACSKRSFLGVGIDLSLLVGLLDVLLESLVIFLLTCILSLMALSNNIASACNVSLS